MPEYCYVCPNCRNKNRIVKPMSESDKPEFCKVNGCVTPEVENGPTLQRDFIGEGFHASGGTYHAPLISDSLAMHPDQIPEHNRMFPDVKVHSDGRPEFTSYKQHNAYLEKTGFVKITQKKRRSQAKIIK